MKNLQDYKYPILNEVFGKYQNEKDLKNIYILSCQHLLEPQLKMFELLIDFGFLPSNILVVGKIYSSSFSVIDDLRELGVTVLQPDFENKPFDVTHQENCMAAYKQIPENAEIVILDDGAEMIKTVLPYNDERVIFAVEQTSSGFRKLENENPTFPIVNVARSKTKLVQESPLIARLCYERIDEHIEKHNLQSPTFLMVGLGAIGEALREILASKGYEVKGFEKDNGDTDLVGEISSYKPDIVVGATGFSVISKDEIEQIKTDKKIHFISVSSSDREFPVADFRTDEGRHDDVISGSIVFANNGFPITFKGNRNELTPLEIEKTIAMLGGGVAHGVVYGFGDEEGLINVPEQIEETINLQTR